MIINIKDEPLQRLQNIASIKGISLEQALKLCIANTYFLTNKKQEGYKLLINKDKEVKEIIKF